MLAPTSSSLAVLVSTASMLELTALAAVRIESAAALATESAELSVASRR